MSAPEEYPSAGQTRASALGAFHHRDFVLFYPAILVEGMGVVVQQTVILWQVYELTSSPLHLGLIGLIEGVPIFAFSLIGGVLADSIDRRRFIKLGQAVGGILNLLLAGLTATGLVEVWHIYLVSLVSASLVSMTTPTRSALVASLVPRTDLLNALTLTSTARQSGRLIAPALAGGAIALLGPAITYGLNGAIYLALLGSLALMKVRPVEGRPQLSPLKSLLEGLSFVRRNSIITVLVGTDVAATFFGSYRALLPVFARALDVGPEGLGLLLSAPAAGGLLGSGLVVALRNPPYRGLLVLGGIFGYCLSLVGLAFSPVFWLALLATTGLGFFDAFQAVMRNSIIQSITPNQLLGRVISFQVMITTGMPAFGRAQSGAVAALIGAPGTLLAGAAICVTLIAWMFLRWPRLRATEFEALPSA